MIEWLLSDNGYPMLLALLSISAVFPIIAFGAYIITIDEEPGLLSVIITAISTTLSILLCLFH